MVRRDSSSASVGRAAGLAVFCGCVLLGVVFEVPVPSVPVSLVVMVVDSTKVM